MRLISSALLSMFLATAAAAQIVPAITPPPDESSPTLAPSSEPPTPSPATPVPGLPDVPAPPEVTTAPNETVSAPVPDTTAGPVVATASIPTAEGQKPGELLGKVEDGRYFSPTKAFDIAIPILAGDRPAVLDNPNIVVFRDDVRTMLTIAAIQMEPIDQWELDTTSHREFLIKFFRENVLSDYNDTFPGTTVESARLVSDLEGGALIVNTLHPNGSAFQVDPIVRNDPATPPPVAKRGNLIFCHGDHVFVVSCELADRVTEMSTYTTDTETEDRILRDRLIDVHSQMHFADEPATAPASTAAAPTATPPAAVPATTAVATPNS